MILASSGPPGGPLEGLLGCLGGLLGASWAALGHLEAILGRFRPYRYAANRRRIRAVGPQQTSPFRPPLHIYLPLLLFASDA